MKVVIVGRSAGEEENYYKLCQCGEKKDRWLLRIVGVWKDGFGPLWEADSVVGGAEAGTGSGEVKHH